MKPIWCKAKIDNEMRQLEDVCLTKIRQKGYVEPRVSGTPFYRTGTSMITAKTSQKSMEYKQWHVTIIRKQGYATAVMELIEEEGE